MGLNVIWSMEAQEKSDIFLKDKQQRTHSSLVAQRLKPKSLDSQSRIF